MAFTISKREIEDFKKESKKLFRNNITIPDPEIIQILTNNKIVLAARSRHFDTTGMNAETYFRFLQKNDYREDYTVTNDGGFEIYELSLNGEVLEHIRLINTLNMSDMNLN